MDTTKHGGSVSNLFSDTLSHSLFDAHYDQLLARFEAASSINELKALVGQIDRETNGIDKQMRQFAEIASKKHSNELSSVDLSRARLSSAIENSSELSRVFASATDLGTSLTSKIKSLDQEIGNVNITLRFVSDIQTLKSNINEIDYSIAKKNWPQAARCIHTINHELDRGLVEGSFASAVIPSADIPDLPSESIEKWTALLKATFVDLFNDAAKRREVKEITSYFQLFPLIGESEVGLACYSKFICSIITDTARSLIGSATKSVANNASSDKEHFHGVYANVASKLFESVSMMLSQHTPLILKYYNDTFPDPIIYVVNRIQREIDIQIGTIADSFYDLNRVDKVLKEIELHKFKALHQVLNDNEHEGGPDDDLVSIVEVGDLVNEFSAILRHWALYCKFVTLKYFTKPGSIDSKDSQPNQEHIKQPEVLLNSNFNKKILTKFLPAFEKLYCFYFRRSLEKSLTIEEVPTLEIYLMAEKSSFSPEQPPVSSVIEDITLVFNTMIRSILDLSQPSIVKNFATSTFQVLQKELMAGFLQKKLADNQPRYNINLALVHSQASSAAITPQVSRAGTPAPETMGGFFKGASSALGNVVGTGTAIVSGASNPSTESNLKLATFIVYLNTVACAQEFFTKIILKFLLKKYLEQTFPFGLDGEKITNVLKNELLHPFTECTSSLTKQSLLLFFNQAIKNKLASLVSDCFPEATDDNYMVTSTNALNDLATILRFKQTWDALMRPYKQTLHKQLCYDKLLRLVVVNIASMIEKRLVSVSKRFKINELGALKLDKDLSFIINEICEDDYELREKFIRVTQLVLLVGMDDEEYEMNNSEAGDVDLDDDTGINWVLTPLERKLIRRFRV